MTADRAPLCGLVLAGGRSLRFGRDKASFRPSQDALPLAARSISILAPWCERVALSVRPNQTLGFSLPSEIELIEDRFGDAGPLGGLLSAWEAVPGAAWLVLACDLAALDRETLEYLVAHRSATRPATAYAHPVNGVPEPLCAIYEPVARRALRSAFAEGGLSLMHYLDAVLPATERLIPARPGALANFNTLADFSRGCREAGSDPNCGEPKVL